MANMLSGSALMDGALLLVAANEKVPRPQTKEHLLALQTLGITEIVIVQNKVDLISYADALANYEDIERFTSKTKAANSPIIPVSSQSNLNTDALISAIESTIKTPARNEESDAVMHVLRSFDVNRPGSQINNIKGGVIGGSLTKGTLQIGDEIEIKPGIVTSKRARYVPIVTEIVSLGTSAGTVKSVKPGGLVAVGTKLDPAMTRRDSLIGSVIGKPDTLPENATQTKITVNLFDSVVGSDNETKVTPIKGGEMLRLNIGTAPILSKVTRVKREEITVEFRRPVCIFDSENVAISRRIADRWRLIGAGTIG